MGTNTISSARGRRPAAESAEIRAVLDALRRIVRELRVSARGAEQQHGISGAQLFVLRQLVAQPARSVGDLAERTFTHQSSVSAVVSRLVARGLVVCRDAPTDARRTEVVLTSAGRAVVRRAPATAQARLIVGLQRLRPTCRRALARGLTAWVREAGITAAVTPLFFEDEARPTRRKRQ